MAEKQAASPEMHAPEAPSPGPVAPKLGPDPVVGVGMVIFGILIMGVAGAGTWHYVFNVGTGLAVLGAIVFLVSVVVSSLRASRSGGISDPPRSPRPG